MGERDVEGQEYARLPRFRAYKEEVASVLQSFDKAREWADLIKCLQRLMKVRPHRSCPKEEPWPSDLTRGQGAGNILAISTLCSVQAASCQAPGTVPQPLPPFWSAYQDP